MVALVASLWFLIGVCLAALGATGVLEAQRRRAWPVARGTIAEGHVLEIHETGFGREHSPGTYFVGVVSYTYALESTTPYRDVPSTMQGKLESCITDDPEEAYALLKAYPVGDTFSVRYDPARPSRSVLGPDRDETQFGAWLASTGMVISAVSAAVALAR